MKKGFLRFSIFLFVALVLPVTSFAVTDIFKEYSQKTITLDIEKRYGDIFKFDYKKIIDRIKDEVGESAERAAFGKVVDGFLQVVPIGPLDCWGISFPDANFMVIYHIEPGGNAEKAGLRRFDEVHGFNGKKFTVATGRGYEKGEFGPVKELGDALDIAQGKGGIQLMVERLVYSKKKSSAPPKKVKKGIVVRMEKLGRFSIHYPAKCRKSEFYNKELKKWAVKELSGRHSKTNILIGLALLASGDPKYLPELQELAMKTIAKEDQINWPQTMYLAEANIGSSWENGFALVYLVEYFFATGDQRVYAALQRMIYNVPDKHQNAFGGFGHGGGNGSYGGMTFGPQGGMNLLGLALAKKLGMKVDPIAFEKYYNMLTGAVARDIRGEKDTLKIKSNSFYTVGYSHTLSGPRSEPRIGESAFNTATAMLALYHMPELQCSKEISLKLRDTIAPFPQLFTFIHAAPGLGHYWCMLAMSATDPSGENLRRLLDYRKYWITYSRFSDGTWKYFYPKYARLAVPGGGGWGGDGYLNLSKVELMQCLLMMNLDKKNLLLQGNKRRNWLKPKVSVGETVKFQKKYDAYFAQASFKKFGSDYGKAIKVRSTKDHDDSLFTLVPLYHKIERLTTLYSSTPSAKSLKSLLARIRGKLSKGDKKRLAYKLAQYDYAYKYSYAVDGHERSKSGKFSEQTIVKKYLAKKYSKYKLPEGSEFIYRETRGMSKNTQLGESSSSNLEDDDSEKDKKKKKRRK